MWRRLHKNNKSPFRVIIFGFFLVILAGSLLLMLPISSQQGVVTPFLDALFTSHLRCVSRDWSSMILPPTGPSSGR